MKGFKSDLNPFFGNHTQLGVTRERPAVYLHFNYGVVLRGNQNQAHYTVLIFSGYVIPKSSYMYFELQTLSSNSLLIIYQ